MYNNYQQEQQTPKQKKQKVNEVTLVGVIRPRSSNENEPFKFYPFKDGGGAIHVNLKVTENMDSPQGPKARTVSIPVDIYTNKAISQQALTSLIPGTTVKIVGSLSNNSYESKKTGQRQTILVVRAFILEVLQMPQQEFAQAPGYGYPAYGQQPAYQQQPQYPPQPQYQQNPAQRAPGAYAPQSPAYAQQNPSYPPMPPQASIPGSNPDNVNFMGGYPNPIDDLPPA